MLENISGEFNDIVEKYDGNKIRYRVAMSDPFSLKSIIINGERFDKSDPSIFLEAQKRNKYLHKKIKEIKKQEYENKINKNLKILKE